MLAAIVDDCSGAGTLIWLAKGYPWLTMLLPLTLTWLPTLPLATEVPATPSNCVKTSAAGTARARHFAKEMVHQSRSPPLQGGETPSFEDCWLKVPRGREEEAVDAGAAIVRGKEISLVAGPLFCNRAEAKSADRPASFCEATVEEEGPARADEVVGVYVLGEGDDDDMSSGTRDGATVRRMVSRVAIRSRASLSLASRA